VEKAFEATLDETVLRLRDDFIVNAEGRLARMATLLSRLGGGVETGADALHLIRRDAHNLKGMGKTYGLPMITVVSWRLEDYLSGQGNLAVGDTVAVRRLIDAMDEVIAGYDSEDPASKLWREFPDRAGALFGSHTTDYPPAVGPD